MSKSRMQQKYYEQALMTSPCHLVFFIPSASYLFYKALLNGLERSIDDAVFVVRMTCALLHLSHAFGGVCIIKMWQNCEGYIYITHF